MSRRPLPAPSTGAVGLAAAPQAAPEASAAVCWKSPCALPLERGVPAEHKSLTSRRSAWGASGLRLHGVVWQACSRSRVRRRQPSACRWRLRNSTHFDQIYASLRSSFDWDSLSISISDGAHVACKGLSPFWTQVACFEHCCQRHSAAIASTCSGMQRTARNARLTLRAVPRLFIPQERARRGDFFAGAQPAG